MKNCGRKQVGKLVLASLLILLLSTSSLSAGEGEGAAPAALSVPVRGVWITATDSDVLSSRENIAQAMDRCRALGINDVFITVWVQGKTLYKSELIDQTCAEPVHERYRGRDPLRECVEEGHRRKLRVHAWFEYGFASSYGDQGGRILEKYPAWTALNGEGRALVKNGFHWMNGFHPGVQCFMMQLFMEVVKNYAVDGVQGDDRLPAMPVEGGYDDYTKALYASEHGGKAPPMDCRDPEWIAWRCHRLDLFLGELSQSVKALNPRCPGAGMNISRTGLAG